MATLFNYSNKKCSIKYSDGCVIEHKMFDYAKNKKVKFSKSEQWPLTYHFSKYREGILNWYPFKENCTILEIGSGCGAITNMLCQKAIKVTSIELEYNRAIINYERNKNLNNLEIIVGDINEICLDNKYDYVILNGVLEYAQYITKKNGNAAYVDLLKKSKSFLKKSGTMLLSIENRLGLKYFTGSKEDHLGTIFSGINGYKKNKIKTFSKQELTDLLSLAKCNIKKWYYPYPDYKFPFEIFTDKTINRISPSVSSLPLDFNQIELMDSKSLYIEFMNNKIMSNFSNSFLIEINNKSSNNIDYIKLSTNRKDEFSIYTIIDYKHKEVYKKPLNKIGKKHINSICNNNYENKLLKTIPYHLINDYCKCELIEGKTLLDEVLADNNKLLPIVKRIYDSLITTKATLKKPNKEFEMIFGEAAFNTPLHWINNVNIDILLNNIYKSNDKFLIIDPEWQYNFYIPAEYIVWRILFNLPQIGICDRKDIKKKIKYLGIDPALCTAFKQMELNFIFKYIGYQGMPYKKLNKIDINKLLNNKQ